ncbi:DUF1737 domain-containing protein [Escherichia coli]|nr:DUF1737 domain-containing protein [Escherichia coli]EEQ7472686.1 DUF1737 domain-containing protein [Escherichia coli]EET9013208.1 DUF1737 domain-containing protein [Escherichia coli]EEU5009255.1 DUF1737 domain-containing protein [Escherichia coli]EEY6244437.1 DUF1737 domain-containing protein [Escherichia coli]
MTFKHYDVVRATSPSDLAGKLTQKLKEGWQPYGSPFISSAGYGAEFIQAIVMGGHVSGTGAVVPDEPEYYYVIALAGQSNSMSYGEGLPLPETYDRPDPRIKQLARRSTVTPGGAACAYNDIIPADHCLHDVQDMSNLNHPKADLNKGQYGCVGQGLHIAKKLLPFIPENAGILLVPCARGGSAFTTGDEGEFRATSGATANSSLWGAGKPLYQDLLSRTKAALDKNPKNILLSVVWMLGEFDLKSATYNQHPQLFINMVNQFRADLAAYASQCSGGNAELVPWICGDTTYIWKQNYATQYPVVYGAYQGKEAQKIYFVPFMTDDKGNKTPTNVPEEDPDLAEVGYFGAASRSNGNWTSGDRATHFSSWARRGVISDRLATAILIYAGRSLSMISGVSPEAGKQKPGGANSGGVETKPGESLPDSGALKKQSLFSYRADVSGGKLKEQGWSAADGKASIVDDAGATGKKAMRVEKAQGSKASWKIMHAAPAANATSLLKNGGEIAFRFRLPDDATLVENRYALALYWPVSALPEGVKLEGDAGSDMMAAFFIQSDAANLNLMYHKGQNQKLGTFGAFNHNWHSVGFRFAGNNSISVVPVIDGAEQPAFNLSKSPASGFAADTLLISDISATQDTYPVLVESILVEVNGSAPAAE